MFCSSLLAAVLALPTAAAPQGPSNHWGGVTVCLPFEPENEIAWPSTGFGNAAAFGRSVILEWNGDFSPDAVVVAGGVAVALFDAAYYDSLQVIPGLGSVTDVAALRLGTDADSDLLLATNLDGLVSVGWSDDHFTAPQVIARGMWINARVLHVDDLDGDGPDDVIGVAQNGLTVVTRIGNGSGFPAGPSCTLGAQIFDAVSIDWDGTGARELAVLTTDGLHIYSGSNLLVFQPHESTIGCIARVRNGRGGELLAWARSAEIGGAELVTLVRLVTEAPKPLQILTDA